MKPVEPFRPEPLMNIRARALATLLAGLGWAAPVLAGPDGDGWAPRKPAPQPTIVIRRAGHEAVAPPAVLPPAAIEVPEIPDPPKVPDPPKMPDMPDKLPTPDEVADEPPPPAMPGKASINPTEPAPAAPAAPMTGATPAGHPGSGLWAEVGYLQWWYRGSALPPLVTAGSLADPRAGALGQPGTRVLFGGGQSGTEWANGVRVRVGGPVDPWSPYGWELGGFYTQPQAGGAAFASRDFPVLARPFYDPAAGTSEAFAFGVTGLVDGQVSVRTRTTFWGLDALATAQVSESHQAFAGLKYLEMTDELEVLTQDRVGAIGTFLNGTFLPAGTFEAQGDRFTVRNQFHGAQAGWRFRHGFGRVGVDVRAALSVGVTSQRLTTSGGTQTVDPLGVARTAGAGLLALPSNSGQFERDRCTAIPELGARVTYEVKPGVSLFAGYDVLYWCNVARAGDQVDLGQDVRQNPSSPTFTGERPSRPAVLLRDTDFWAHGFTFGVRVEY